MQQHNTADNPKISGYSKIRSGSTPNLKSKRQIIVVNIE